MTRKTFRASDNLDYHFDYNPPAKATDTAPAVDASLTLTRDYGAERTERVLTLKGDDSINAFVTALDDVMSPPKKKKD